MRRKYNSTQNDSPFTRWLIEQANQHNISLAKLARRAGLSSGTLRGLTVIVGRQPTIDTCLRLARTLDVPYQEVLTIAGFSPALPDDPNLLDPDRAELVRLYDDFSPPARRLLVLQRKVASFVLI